jgi:hypothetical protein
MLLVFVASCDHASVRSKRGASLDRARSRVEPCHGTGTGGAPRIGDRKAWADRATNGLSGLSKSAFRAPDDGNGEHGLGTVDGAIGHLGIAGETRRVSSSCDSWCASDLRTLRGSEVGPFGAPTRPQLTPGQVGLSASCVSRAGHRSLPQSPPEPRPTDVQAALGDAPRRNVRPSSSL